MCMFVNTYVCILLYHNDFKIIYDVCMYTCRYVFMKRISTNTIVWIHYYQCTSFSAIYWSGQILFEYLSLSDPVGKIRTTRMLLRNRLTEARSATATDFQNFHCCCPRDCTSNARKQ